MSSDKKTRKQAVFASLLLHLLVFSGVGYYVDFIPASARQGDKQSTYITSYLYQLKQLEAVQAVKKTSSQRKAAGAPPPMPLLLNRTQRLLADLTGRSPNLGGKHLVPALAQAQSGLEEEPANGLLALLHAAIQSKQQYPPSALQLGRQGRVKMGFKLYPNGSISDLHLIKSSGTASLDLAALAAARLAVPFKQVSTYLKNSTEFSVEVVFALGEENE